MTKVCPKCHKEKPLEGFAVQRRAKSGRQSYCRSCNKAYRENNKERVNGVVKDWYRRTGWEQRLTRSYGTPSGWYHATLEQQGGGCAICGTPPLPERRLYVDHNHDCCPQISKSSEVTCGRCVRGLLCSACNVSLGHLERPKWLASAKAYLGWSE